MTEPSLWYLAAFRDGEWGMGLATFRCMFCIAYSGITKERNNDEWDGSTVRSRESDAFGLSCGAMTCYPILRGGAEIAH